ncbi:hypothetical protein LP7551_04755 [Roseibium album]|nr:hypothetical protein LP7551_04755 [Roseibium album]
MSFGFELLILASAVLLVVALPLVAYSGFKKTNLPANTVTKNMLFLTGALVVWLVLTAWLSSTGIYSTQLFSRVPIIGIAISVPIVLGVLVYRRSATARLLLQAIPQSHLIGIQAYRAFGFVFLILWGQGLIPGLFALPAGIGDILTGVGAVLLAVGVGIFQTGNRLAIRFWNSFGIADLVLAVFLGTITSPTPLQLAAFDMPNALISAYPLALIPTFAVPIAILLHLASLAKLRQEEQSTEISEVLEESA